MSELSDFLRNLDASPFDASKTLVVRAEKFIEKLPTYPDAADNHVASLMAEAFLPLALEAELVTEKQIKELDSYGSSSGSSRLQSLAKAVRAAIRIRESASDSEAGREAIEKLIAASRAKQGEETFGYAFLTPEEKKIIHERLNAIRATIDSSELSHRKKNALFGRLNSLAKEVDAAGTATDRFFAFMGDLAYTAGDMAVKAKPAIDETKEVLRIVVEARARAEKVQLPKPKDWPLIPSRPQDTKDSSV